MKLHLPHQLLAALMAACAAPVTFAEGSGNTSAPATDLGNVMYVGDSITHGVNSASWRWAMHKIFTDNGVSYTPVGYKTGNASGGVANGTTYCGEAFANVHSAQSSARAWEVAGRSAGGRFDNTNLQNWLGQSTTKTGGGTYTGSTYDVDTFYLLIGTNDLISDGTLDANKNSLTESNYAGRFNNLLGTADANGVRSGGDMKTILDAMYTEKADAPVVILTVPCWTNHDNNNGDAPHQLTQQYNEELTKWVANYNATNNKNAMLVDVNKGMVDVASSKPFYGCSTMFGNPGTDGLHPSAHGDLIMAGAVAKAQGYAGRTAGQQRMAASGFAHQAGDFTLTSGTIADGNITLADGGTATLNWTEGADLTHGYTVDFALPDGLGNGATDGWGNGNLAITLGNGTIGGTLNISEAYIKWGDSVLYSLDMSGSDTSTAYTVFNTAESLRVAYVIGNTEANLSGGFYVWMDDMLIGEACGIIGTNVDGVGITNGTGSNVTLGGLAATEHAYAPTTTRVMVSNNVIEPYIPDVGKDVATKAWSSDGAISATMDNGAASTANSNVIIGSGSAANPIIINSNATPAGGTTWIDVTGAAVSTSYSQIVGNGATHTGNVNFRIDDAYQNTTQWGTIFGTNNGKIDGNLYMEFSSATLHIANGSYTDTNGASVAGGFQSNGVTGAVTMVFNAGTFEGNILGGGIKNRGDFGSTDLHVFGGSFRGNIYGGGEVGTISGGTSVILTGDAYELTGDSKTISAGGTGGTIQGGTTLTIKDMGTDTSGEGKGIANYTGNLTLSGNDGATVTGQKKLAFINSTHNNFRATLSNFDAVELTESNLQINGGLGGATALKLDPNSSLTLNAGSYGEMQVASSGAITLKGGSSMTLSQTNNDSQISGTFEVQEGSALGMGAGYKTQSTYTIKDGAMLSMANGATLLGGSISLESGSVVNVLEGATATIQGGLSGHLNLAGPGTLVLAEDTTTTLDSLRGGTLLNSGTLTVGNIGPLSGTLVNDGNLTITGQVSLPRNLSKLKYTTLGVVSTSGDFTQTLGYAAGDAVSGYYYNAYFLVGSTENGTLNAQNATFADGIEVAGDFVYVQSLETTTYHINENAIYSTHDAYNVTENGRTVQVEDGYTLTLDTSVRNGVKLATVDDGAVNLNSGTTEISLGTGAATLQNVYVGEGNEATVAHATVESTPIRVDDGGLLHVNVTNTNNLNFNISKLSGEGTVALSNSTNSNVIFSGANAPAGFNGTLVLDGKSWNCFDGTTWNFSEIDGKYASLHINAGGRGVALGNYKTEADALNIGNLSGAGDISPSYGDAGSHYLAVHQNKETIYSGSAQKDSTRNISILKYGESNLILSGANTSTGALKVKEGTLTFTTTGSWAGATTVEDGATLAYIGGAKNYTGNISFETGSTLRVLGAGTLADTEFAAGNLTFASDATISKLIVDEGASATVNANTTLTIGATMQIDGTFTNNGTVAVSSLANLEAVGGTQYTDRISPTSGNGYETAVYSVYTGNGTVTGLSALSIAGSETSYEIDSAGQVRVGESNGRYFINQGTVVYGGDDNVAASDTTQFLVLNGGTLELAQDLRNGHTLSLAKNSTLQIDAGVTVQNTDIPSASNGATITLAGVGTYDNGSSWNLNSTVVLGDGWTGAVKVSNITGITNLDFNNLGLSTTRSFVEISGLKGYFNVGQNTFTTNLILTDSAAGYAMRVDNGNSNTAQNYMTDGARQKHIFTGTIKGDGTLLVSADKNGNSFSHHEFNGDVSGWTGTYILSDGTGSGNKARNGYLAFKGTGNIATNVKVQNIANVDNALEVAIAGASGSRTISGDFTRTNNNILNLTLSDAATKTFTGNVDASTLAVTGGAATFSGALKAATLNIGTAAQGQTAAVNGSVALGGESTLGDVNLNAGSITFNTGSRTTVNGNFNTGATDVAINNGTFVAGADFAKSGSGKLTFSGTNVLESAAGMDIRGGTVCIHTGNSAAQALELGDVKLAEGTTLEQYSDNGGYNNYAHRQINISTLTLTGDATLKQSAHNGYFNIGDMTLAGHTLTLNPVGPSTAYCTYVFNGAQAENDAASIVKFTHDSRAAVISIGNENALRNSVLTVTEPSGSYYGSIAVAADNTNLLGLTGTGKWKLVSHASIPTGTVDNGVNSLNGDGVVRTLTITGEGGSYAGSVGKNLNIVMSGTGTQDFTGTNTAMNGSIAVESGTLGFTSAVGSLTSIDVNGGTLNLAGGTTDNLNVAGTLNVKSGTLAVNNLLALKNGGTLNLTGTLALGEHYVIDLTGLDPVEGNTYRIIDADSARANKLTGIANGAIDMSHIRANGIGWSASYLDGAITLTQVGTIVKWNSATTAATWTTTSTGFVDSASIGTSGTNHVMVESSVTATLGEDIAIASLGVDTDKTLTLTGTDRTLTVKDINLEDGATLDASGITIAHAAGDTGSVDVSTGATFVTNSVSGELYTGDGTVKIGFTGTGTATMAAGSQFTGTVDVTSGTADIGGSSISSGTWKLEAGVNAAVSGTVSNDIVFAGECHNLTAADATTISSNLSGSAFTKDGAGALTLTGTTDVTGMTVSAGTVTLGGTANTIVNDLTVGTGDLTFTAGTNLTVNGTIDVAEGKTVGTLVTTLTNGTAAGDIAAIHFTAGENLVKKGAGTLSIKDTPSLTNVRVEGGTLQFVANGGNYGNVTLAGGNLSIGTLSANSSDQIFNSVTLDNADGMIECVVFQVSTYINGMSLGGHTLTLSDLTTAAQSTYTFAGADAGSGKVKMLQKNARKMSIVLNGTDTLCKAVLDIATEASANKTILVAQDTVKVGGLANSGTHSGTTYLLSRAATRAEVTASDSTVRTLEISGVGGTLTAVVGANLNLAMSGTGTQTIEGNLNSFNGTISVSAGTLNLTNTQANGVINTGNSVTLDGGALKLGNNASFTTVSGAEGATLDSTTTAAHTLTLTGEGGTFAGTLGKLDITLASTATGTHAFTGANSGSFGSLTVNAGTLQLASSTDATVGTLTLADGAAITDSGTLTVSNLAVAGGAINNTNLVYTGAAATTIAAAMDGSSLEVAAEAGKVTLSGATKNLVNLTIGTSNNEEPADDILLDADVSVSGTISLGNNAQIGFGDNRQLSWNGFTYTTDADSNTKGTISKGAEGTTVTVSNMRIMSTVDEEHSIAFELDNVRLVNTAGTATLTAAGNQLSDIVVSGGKVVLAENTTVANDVNLAVQSAQLEVAAGKTLTNGVVTLKGANNKALLIDNTTANASVFYGNGEASAAIISGAEVTVNTTSCPGQNYTWGAQLVSSSLEVTGNLTLHNSEKHQITSFSINPQATLTLKNGCAMDYLTGTYEANMEGLDGTIHNGHTDRETMNLNCASTTVSNMTITLTSKSEKEFYMGVQNVDLVRDYADDAALVVKPNWVKDNAKNFHNLEAKQGEINIAGHAFAKGDVIVGDTGKVTVDNGIVLKVDNDVITITGTSGKAKITAETAGSSLAGADATAKVSDATLAVNNTGSETYVWGAQIANSSLTTSGDVKLTNSNSVTSLTVNEGATLTLTGDMTATGAVTIKTGATLNVVDAAFSANSLTGGTLNLTDNSATHGHVGEGASTDGLSALMAACSLETSDVVVNAAGAIDGKALLTEDFMGKTFTLDIFSNVTVKDGVTLTLAGMENYKDVKLFWSVEQPTGGAGPALLRSGADGDAPYSMDYTGKVTLTGLEGVQNGSVVSVWATAVVPEPTTGALSVLALAALAARRRRKASGK